ncbi:B mating type pheromone [Pleurotus ostreatus PC15]|uniref:B mating type pheromone n=1 Tax=Pleurotus ostreatus (strain PC15) TaxID=1137138 RepID=A0A067NHN4_PLEO1|nr:B mating type pheromone [Pleurotus ostreatus PC15]
MDTFNRLESLLTLSSSSWTEAGADTEVAPSSSSHTTDDGLFDLPVDAERDIPGFTSRGWCIIS